MSSTLLSQRFRGFMPVIIDVETGGVDPRNDALLELGAVSVKMDDNGLLHPDAQYHYHIMPFEGANLNPESMAFNKIDPGHPFRFAVSESEALKDLFSHVKKECKQKGCSRAVLVGHNAWFDQHFINNAATRCNFNKIPFHCFTSFDTATLSGLVYGQTVLSKAMEAAKIPFDNEQAHSALYDAQCTAQLFCAIVNQWALLGGWKNPSGFA